MTSYASFGDKKTPARRQNFFGRKIQTTFNDHRLIMRRKLLYVLSSLLFVIPHCSNLYAQDQASLILDLKRAKASYESAQNKFENDTKLLGAQAISQMEYSRSRNDLLSAEVEYQKLMLRLISEQSYIIVEKAVKYQTASGDKRVKLSIRSSMDGNQDYLNQFQEHIDLFTPEMRSGKTYNIFVSLNSLEEKTIIGSPYEKRVLSMDLGETVDVDFGLLKDVESLQVVLNYNNTKDEKNILLEKDASTSFIDATSTQFSQEADLGSSANYDISLERFSSSADVFKLMVLNLPRQISYAFEDVETGARLSNLRFNQGVNIRKLALKAYLPERDDDEYVSIDKPIVFYAVALAGDNLEEFESDPNKIYTEDELNNIPGGKIKLELIPRGIGKLEVRATNLYHEITTKDEITMDVVIKNYGTRRVDNIKIEIDKPLNWIANVDRPLITSLEPEQEETIQLVISPSGDESVGAQEVKIKTIAYSDNRLIEANDRVIRIQVKAAANVLGTVLLVLLLIGVVAGTIIFGIKISKR